MGIKRVHRLLISGVGAKADEAIRPHKDCPAAGDAGRSGIELRGRRIDNGNKLAPTGTEIIQARHLAESDQMVARAAQEVARRKARSRR